MFDLLLLIIGVILCLIGIVGSFVPIIPGPMTSWFGLLVLNFTDAVNFNLPCISTRCSGATDILSKKYGTYIPRYNHELLAEKMVDSILNYKKILLNTKKIKKNLSRFLIKPQVSKYISYCNSILNSSNK